MLTGKAFSRATLDGALNAILLGTMIESVDDSPDSNMDNINQADVDHLYSLCDAVSNGEIDLTIPENVPDRSCLEVFVVFASASNTVEEAESLSIQVHANASNNLSKNSLYHQFHKYHESVSGDLGGDKMWELTMDIKNSMPEGVKIACSRHLELRARTCVAIVTPPMERVHAVINQAAEIDTTYCLLISLLISHVAFINTSVTPCFRMLTW